MGGFVDPSYRAEIDMSSESTVKLKVLFADDDPDIRFVLRDFLEGKGFELAEATNGAEGLELFLVEAPDLVILDVMMPELSGWEVVKYIRAREEYADVGVIMLSGVGEIANEAAAGLYGADAHLDKPFDLDELSALITQVLASKGHA